MKKPVTAAKRKSHIQTLERRFRHLVEKLEAERTGRWEPDYVKAEIAALAYALDVLDAQPQIEADLDHCVQAHAG